MAIMSITLSAIFGTNKLGSTARQSSGTPEKITSKLLLLAGARSPEIWYGDRAIARLQ